LIFATLYLGKTMRATLGILVFLGFLSVLPSEARAHPLLDQAIASYEEADFQAALRTFDAAARNADLSVEELLHLFEMRALVYHALGNRGAMQDDLRRLAAVRPSYRLSRLAPPPVRQAFDQMLEANGGSLGVELVIEEQTFDGAPFIVARVAQVPKGLVDHVGLQCRVGEDGKTTARTAQGSLVRLELPKSGEHSGCEATAHTRQGSVLFNARLEGIAAKTAPNVFQMPEYQAQSDEPTVTKKKRWPWFVAAAGLVVVGGVTAGVVLSKRSQESQSSPGGVTVNW
jgi:hypothetical protein